MQTPIAISYASLPATSGKQIIGVIDPRFFLDENNIYIGRVTNLLSDTSDSFNPDIAMNVVNIVEIALNRNTIDSDSFIISATNVYGDNISINVAYVNNNWVFSNNNGTVAGPIASFPWLVGPTVSLKLEISPATTTDFTQVSLIVSVVYNDTFNIVDLQPIKIEI